MKIGVFCGASSGKKEIYKQNASELGQYLAHNKFDLVYGGGNVGLMGTIAQSVHHYGGYVIGVIPEKLMDRELGYKEADELIIVDDMHERKAKMAEYSDAFIALPGGIGTMEEIFEQWTWLVLGFHHKPCAILNLNGYYDSFIDMVDKMVAEGFLKQEFRDCLYVGTSIDDIFSFFDSFEKPKEKWA